MTQVHEGFNIVCDCNEGDCHYCQPRLRINQPPAKTGIEDIHLFDNPINEL